MIDVVPVPWGIEDIEEKFGKPDKDEDGICDPSWMKENLEVFLLPQPLRLSWNPQRMVGKIQAHRLVGPAICDAFEEIIKEVGIAELRQKKWDYYGGCFEFRRNRRDDRKLSTHCWAISIDLNPHLCLMGMFDDHQPKIISEAFMERGFYWVPGDWMHAQACRGY
jgi:hypothetical protein